MQNNQTLQKPAEINFTIWIQLTSFWSMSCVFLCTLSICTVYYFASLLKPLLRARFFLRPLWPFDHVLNIMLCFLCLFVLLYDIGIKFDMIWYMIWLHKAKHGWENSQVQPLFKSVSNRNVMNFDLQWLRMQGSYLTCWDIFHVTHLHYWFFNNVPLKLTKILDRYLKIVEYVK